MAAAGHLLMSFHGLPLSYVTRGDRYADECRQTAGLLAAAVEFEAQRVDV
jgi:ferrochelatase